MLATFAAVSVPGEVAGLLRSGLHVALGQTAQAIDSATIEAGREAAPGLYAVLLAEFDDARALLDAIGWVDEEPVAPVSLDLAEHRSALLHALQMALVIAEAEVAEPPDATPAEPVDLTRHEQRVARLRALRDFAATVDRSSTVRRHLTAFPHFWVAICAPTRWRVRRLGVRASRAG